MSGVRAKIDLAIVIVLMQLRDVLVLAHDFDSNYALLESLFSQIQQHMEKEYDPELVKASSTAD